MRQIRTIQGELAAGELRFAIVAARFNAFIVDRLIEGALAAFERERVAPGNIEIVRVPGAFELPATVAQLLGSSRYDAIIALGAVIRGETPHFDYVAGECARGLSMLSIQHKVPVIFGVLTTDTAEQALARAVDPAQIGPPPASSAGNNTTKEAVKETTQGGNKGAEAALCAIEMANLFRKLAE